MHFYWLFDFFPSSLYLLFRIWLLPFLFLLFNKYSVIFLSCILTIIFSHTWGSGDKKNVKHWKSVFIYLWPSFLALLIFIANLMLNLSFAMLYGDSFLIHFCLSGVLVKLTELVQVELWKSFFFEDEGI